MPGEPLLTARGLARDYGPRRAVADIDLAIAGGDVLGVLGANGAGKSTILRMLAGTLAPSAGTIRVAGHDLQQAARKAKTHIGFLPERPPVYPELTVDEYLEFAARLHGVPRAARADAVRQARADTGLEAVGGRLIGQLSKGFVQRAGIAQAILHRPDVLILDEPTAGLDPHQLAGVRELVRRLSARHAVIVSSHILSEIQAIATRVLIVAGGRIRLDRPLASLDDDNDWVEIGFAGGPSHAELAAMPDVVEVRAIDAGRWWLRARAGQDIRVALARTAAERGWALHTLVARAPSLEQRFIALTQDAAPTERAS